MSFVLFLCNRIQFKFLWNGILFKASFCPWDQAAIPRFPTLPLVLPQVIRIVSCFSWSTPWFNDPSLPPLWYKVPMLQPVELSPAPVLSQILLRYVFHTFPDVIYQAIKCHTTSATSRYLLQHNGFSEDHNCYLYIYCISLLSEQKCLLKKSLTIPTTASYT